MNEKFITRRNMFCGLAGLGLFSVLDYGCYHNNGHKDILIGFEPFKEGEKKVWFGPKNLMDDTQVNDFFKQVLPSIFIKDGIAFLDKNKFVLIDNKLSVVCDKVLKKNVGKLQYDTIINNNLKYGKVITQENRLKAELKIEDNCIIEKENLVLENVEDGILISNETWKVLLQYINNSLLIVGSFTNQNFTSVFEYICDSDGNFGYFDFDGKYYVELFDENDNVNSFFIKDYETVLKFLTLSNNIEFLRIFLNKAISAKTHFDLTGISKNMQIRELLRLIPEEMDNKLILSAFRYHLYDSDENEKFRLLLNILQSGLGDCGDYTIANTVWAITHGYEPFVVDLDGISKIGGCSNIIGEHLVGHIFMYFVNSNYQTVVCNNQEWIILDSSKTIYDYIEEVYPDYSIGDIYKVPVLNGKMIFEL